MIDPSVGRVVWYRPSDQDHKLGMQIFADGQPLKADVVYVWSNTEVNLSVIDHNGTSHRRTHVPINVENRPGQSCAEWMGYQLGQAAKTEALEKKLKESSS